MSKKIVNSMKMKGLSHLLLELFPRCTAWRAAGNAGTAGSAGV